MIEMRTLAYFVATMRAESLTSAAETLDIALSTLSAALSTFEQDVGIPLFRRADRGLAPTGEAQRLVRLCDDLLQAEAFARRWSHAAPRSKLRSRPDISASIPHGELQPPHDEQPPQEASRTTRAPEGTIAGPPRGSRRAFGTPHHEAHGASIFGRASRVLMIEMRLGHTIGGTGRVLRQAIATFCARRANIFVRPVWAEDDLPASPWIGEADRDALRIVIDYSDGPKAPGRAISVFDDRWVFACRLPPISGARPRAAALLAGRLVVPRLPPALLDQVGRYLDGYESARVRFAEEPPSELPRLLAENPDAALLLPGTMAAPQLGAPDLALIATDEPLSTGIVARTSRTDPVTRAFLQHLQRAFAEPSRVPPERPQISLKQIVYFNAVHRIRRISAAAQSVNISQPALSEQIRKLETIVGTAFFARSGGGVVPTPSGERFAEIAHRIERSARRISSFGRAASPAGHRVAIGILPSVSQHGYLVNRVAEALLDAQARHPGVQLDVQEAPNATLQEWVMRGIVGVAIVETGLPHVPRLPLGSSEALAVIADPRFGLLPAGSVTFSDAARLPLILPTARSGLRQLVDAAARERGLKLRPQMEIGGLAMMAAILARRPLCTMLPPSAVLREIESGDLVARALVDPVIERRLFVIHSAERALSAPERDIVRTLREKLAGPMALA